MDEGKNVSVVCDECGASGRLQILDSGVTRLFLTAEGLRARTATGICKVTALDNCPHWKGAVQWAKRTGDPSPLQ
jgi:hypothetical protein